MQNNEQLKELVDQFPEPDPDGRYANLDQEKVERMEKVVAKLSQGGQTAVLGLIDMLVEPGKGDDVKAHYALHLLAVQATRKGSEPARAEFARALASQIGGNRPREVQRYLIEQLQITGTRETTAALGKVLLDTDLCDPAARALAAIGDGAADQLLAALPKVREFSRQQVIDILRLSIIKKLAVLRSNQAAEIFKDALDDANPEIRMAGAWGIARIADASAARVLLKCAEAHKGWERIKETDACLTLAENLAGAGKKAAAAAIYAQLRKTRSDPSERHVREAARRGLAAMR